MELINEIITMVHLLLHPLPVLQFGPNEIKSILLIGFWKPAVQSIRMEL